MKKLISFLLIIFVLSAQCTVFAKPNTDGLKSKNLLVIDTNSQRSVFKKNADTKIAPGGLTKILTAIVVIENMMDINELVTAKSDTVASYDYSYGNMGILADEQLSIKDLLNGMLLYDAGDAAEVLASYIFENRDKFIKEMNTKAKQLGAKKSNFVNASGYPDDKQYSTLSDLALITQYAMNNDTFAQIVAQPNVEIAPSNKYKQKRYLNNTNKFVCPYISKDYYTENASGVKTSYNSNDDCGLIVKFSTDKTGFLCLISGAPYDGTTNYTYEDAKILFNYAKSYYKTVKVVSSDEIAAEIPVKNAKGTNRVLLVSTEDIYANLPSDYDKKLLKTTTETDKNVKAPIKKGDAYGVITVTYDGEKYATGHLVASQDLEAAPLKGILFAVLGIFTSTPFKIVVLIIIVLYIAFTMFVNHIKRKKRRLKRLKQKQRERQLQNNYDYDM